MMLCLFDDGGAETQVPLRDYDAGVWHGFVPGIGPGQAYGYRATGPYDPARGVRCNPAKLLLDPYARAITGAVTFGPEVLGYAADDPDLPSALDSAASVPRSLVVAGDDLPLGGRRPAAPPLRRHGHLRGARQGLHHAPPGHPAGAARHLRRARPRGGHRPPARPRRHRGRAAAGPRERARRRSCRRAGLTNYWGYNTIGYFAPHQGYSAAVRAGQPGGQVAEFKAMVDALHGAGLEVILDVVFNHTAEGNELGPTLCFRGLDNPAYYRLEPGRPAHVRRHDRHAATRSTRATRSPCG